MNVLSIETSSPILSVAVRKGEKTVEINFKKGLYHAEHLVPLVERALKKLKLQAKRLDLIACGIGPGSFTGLRIGLSAAKGFALGLGIPAIPISSLDLIAEASGVRDGVLAVILDARRERVYAAIYEFSKGLPRKKLLKDSITPFDELSKRLASVTHVTGDGIRLYRDEIERKAKHEIVFLNEKVWYPRAIHAFPILERQKKVKVVELRNIKPAYLGLTEAEERRKQTDHAVHC